MKNKILSFIIFSIFIVGCTTRDVYFQYNTVNAKGWSKDSLYVFNVPITDTSATYNVYINLRNSGDYPYQNLWLFLSRKSPNKTGLKDSIECYLADQRGKWLGTGLGSIREMPILYQQNVKFDQPGTYNYYIVQGMRDSILTGINDIGMRVEKVESK